MPEFRRPDSDERMVWQTLDKILTTLNKSLDLQEDALDQLNAQTEELQTQTALLQQIADGLTPQPLTASIALSFPGEPMSLNALVFKVGDAPVVAPLVALLADGVTPSGGVFSNVTITFSDPSATVVLNADGISVTATPVAASTGAVSGTTAATVTDTDGVVSTWSQPFTVTTNAATPPPQQLTQSIGIQFP